MYIHFLFTIACALTNITLPFCPVSSVLSDFLCSVVNNLPCLNVRGLEGLKWV